MTTPFVVPRDDMLAPGDREEERLAHVFFSFEGVVDIPGVVTHVHA
jgi:hypothetical protein